MTASPSTVRTPATHVDGARSFSAAFILTAPLLVGALLKVFF